MLSHRDAWNTRRLVLTLNYYQFIIYTMHLQSKEHGRNILRQISQIHHRLGVNPLDLPGGATSTPSANTGDLGKKMKADTQQITPILPQSTSG